MAQSLIPDIPGELLKNPDIRDHLNRRVAQLCGRNNDKFPGSQPISFSTGSLKLLEQKDFWVCEKSDGVRILLFIVMNGHSGAQEVWLIDRKQRYFLIHDLHFTHWERVNDPLTDTILDGELIIDVDPRSGAQTLRFYAFDCLVIEGENIMSKPLIKRYARLREWVIAPMKKALERFPEWAEMRPFEIVAKQQELGYHIQQVLNVHIPKLHHGHDGLIFTCAETEYVPGTDPMILKWKPPSENSVDFRLELRFPPGADGEPDLRAKPVFLLNQWLGGGDYEFFDELDVDDDEWEAMKESGEAFDDRIVEVTWDTRRQGWRKHRYRDDKPDGNHASVVKKILQSIEDGVEIEALVAHSDAIRTAWKTREAARRRQQPQRPPQGAQRPPPQSVPPKPQAPAQGVVAGLKR